MSKHLTEVVESINAIEDTDSICPDCREKIAYALVEKAVELVGIKSVVADLMGQAEMVRYYFADTKEKGGQPDPVKASNYTEATALLEDCLQKLTALNLDLD